LILFHVFYLIAENFIKTYFGEAKVIYSQIFVHRFLWWLILLILKIIFLNFVTESLLLDFLAHFCIKFSYVSFILFFSFFGNYLEKIFFLNLVKKFFQVVWIVIKSFNLIKQIKLNLIAAVANRLFFLKIFFILKEIIL